MIDNVIKEENGWVTGSLFVFSLDKIVVCVKRWGLQGKIFKKNKNKACVLVFSVKNQNGLLIVCCIYIYIFIVKSSCKINFEGRCCFGWVWGVLNENKSEVLNEKENWRVKALLVDLIYLSSQFSGVVYIITWGQTIIQVGIVITLIYLLLVIFANPWVLIMKLSVLSHILLITVILWKNMFMCNFLISWKILMCLLVVQIFESRYDIQHCSIELISKIHRFAWVSIISWKTS